ncbi:ribosomal protein S12 methylthiotransferase accessory factor YcaO [Desulfomicrobium macestii]|uniref:Ribosomal protein S12 methylthiotransferase accessory factor YcaO n=1 Tax=Desulfomicrobium macestii TaxID=90731 RepID=A0ABR9H924_9BACT|nr:YcaO-like family protein [Desulfomicrobium macestii]MBE1427048.1 ribosomal protein S12 methylthiotransferase accessory factor YcaO [Desulfomicrobium macestii]
MTTPRESAPLRYRLTHQESLLGVAYFSPAPAQSLTLEECLEHVRRAPNDEFMRAHVRQLLAALDAHSLRALHADADPVVKSLVLETVLLTPTHADLWTQLRAQAKAAAELTPQIFLRSVSLPDHDLHARASRLLAANIFEHQPLPGDMGALPLTAAPDSDAADPAMLKSALDPLPHCPRRPARQTYALAMERLYGLGILDGPEMRHHASLAPWGLLRRWKLDRATCSGRFNHRLEGLMTSYGRGLCLEDAQASLAMEIVERYSSFADIRGLRISGSGDEGEIRVGTCRELGDRALDPNSKRLEVPYAGQTLHWMTARDRNGQARFVPVQSVYLFTNLDEIRLFSGLGSTGLASGNTPEEAKVSGLLEVVERDAEAVGVFDPARCFRVQSGDEGINRVLEQYRAQGIDPVFQDLTTDLGVPCYKCFAQMREGGLVKATGASLSGMRAALSALTETPFPFPGREASAQGPDGLPVRTLEDLPDHSTGSAAGDLALLEAILDARGHSPLYADLTKRELRLPVFRAIVPGLEIVSDFDRFTRISPRLWRDVLRLKGRGA